MESVFAFLRDIFDVLVFETNEKFNEKLVTHAGVKREENSVLKAARILIEHFKIALPKVKLYKRLPVCSGLGGGSSNSACFINSIFDILKFSSNKKLEYIDMFDSLGADNKVFLYKYFTNSRNVYLRGTGLSGVITDIDINVNGRYILVVNDGIELQTKRVFDEFRGPFFARTTSKSIDILHDFNNSLQAPAIRLVDSLELVIEDIKATNPVFCGVSGSGSSCFGFYVDFKTAKFAKESLLTKYKFVEISRI